MAGKRKPLRKRVAPRPLSTPPPVPYAVEPGQTEEGEPVSANQPPGQGTATTSRKGDGWLLSLNLSVAVPFEVDDLYRMFRTQEGIVPWMVAEAIQFGAEVLPERGDRLLYRSERPGETADLFVGLARTLAILSFVEGGVTFAEQRFDARMQLVYQYGVEKAHSFCSKAFAAYWKAVVSTVTVACWSEREEALAYGTWNALPWLEHASDTDLLHLRAGHVRGEAILEPNASEREGFEQRLLTWLCALVRERVRHSSSWEAGMSTVESLGDQLLLDSCDRSREIAFQVDGQAVEAWLALNRHALLTGERYILPPERTRRRNQGQ